MARSDSPLSSSEEANDEAKVLTPRSKVKALLASIESDSDEDATTAVTATGRRRSSLAAVSEDTQNLLAKHAKIAKLNASEEGDSSEDDAIVPRGRLAAHLETHITGQDSPTSKKENSGSEHAYMRIKRRLLNGPEKTKDGPSGGRHSRSSTIAARTSRSTSPIQESANDVNFGNMERPKELPTSLQPRTDPSHSTEADAQSPLLPSTHSMSEHDGLYLEEQLPTKNRLLELVTKKREEREAKNIEEKRKRAEKIAQRREFENILSQDASGGADISDNDDLAEQNLTQSARPTRKASKKALEEMNRETQRMNRNMQLAHQAKTKKKITKDSLFARFNFRTSTVPTENIPEHPSSSTIPSSAPQSDGEDTRVKDSPPTSPAEPIDEPLGKSILRSTVPTQGNMTVNPSDHAMTLEDDDLPETADLFKGPLHLDRVKAGPVDSLSRKSPLKKKKISDLKQRSVRLSLPNLPSKHDIDLDSDSDLEKPLEYMYRNPRPKTSKLDAFHRLPANKLQEGRSLLTLRALAHLNSPDDLVRGRKPSVNVSDMRISLQKRARLQALEERKAKIDDLKARGVLVQTSEDREKDQAEVEDLLEKARREAEELQQKEKKAAKKEKFAKGEIEGVVTSDDDDEDGDYGEGDDADVELSGSDDEDVVPIETQAQESNDGESELEEELEEEEEDLEPDDEVKMQKGPIDTRAEEELGKDEAAEDEFSVSRPPRTRRNKTTIEDDDDDDQPIRNVSEAPTKDVIGSDEPQMPAIDIPRFPPMAGEAGPTIQALGMTQAFAATMAETQGDGAEYADEEQDSMAFFHQPPEPDLSLFNAEDSQLMVQDSQTGRTGVQDTAASHQIDLHFSQSQLQHDTLGPLELLRESTELTEIPDPTQDAGFALSSPTLERFISVPPSTVDTVLIPALEERRSPALKPRGRLVRGRPVQAPNEQEDVAADESIPSTRDAFKAMRERRQKKAEEVNFNKKRSDAREMVEEQAMESEDEYAGLGGASDDESGGEEDQDVKEMMDHSHVDVDEGQLAALYANKERASDEKAVEKLFKDINNGGLRRKRGADFELSDSDDDGEARRRRKQREFAKMRKALLADEKVGQIAEDPKKLAFLRAIEDREDDDDDGLDFLDRPAEDSFRVVMDIQEDGVGDSQSQQQPNLPATQEENNTTKRRDPLQETNSNMRPPPTSRRTPAGPTTKKPSTLAEIRESVSFLTELPGAMNAPDPSSSASEAEDDNNHPNTHSHPHPRRTVSNPIVDRLLLKRASSTTTTSSSSASGPGSRLAFYDPTSTTTTDGFKIPSLLRRATTNLSESAGVDKNGISTYAATERAAAGSDDRAGFKKGSRKCSVNYFAREMEMKGVVEGVERRRREERERRARERRDGGLGGLVGGGFFD